MKTNPPPFPDVRRLLVITLALTLPAFANDAPQEIPFVQDWANAALITKDNDWSDVPGFMGYRGDKLTAKPGANPQTITQPGTDTPVNVIANQKNPNTLRTGGLAEFDGIGDHVVALKGSATAGAPFLLLNLSTKGKQNVAVGYKLRDIDGSANNAVQAVAFQFRVGTNVAFTDLAAAFVPDPTTGPGLATLVTPIIAVLPAEANDQPLVQVRWITANAEGNDEWVGVDDIAVIGDNLGATSPAKDAKRTEIPASAGKSLRSPKDVGKD
ncbi:MAG: hypothetical protein EPO07_01110 [Verrucomicrobia bacterium]|nr:MAG: hypothetical protein EPO07_01110 [Verrucomicrobiota bacterium]